MPGSGGQGDVDVGPKALAFAPILWIACVKGVVPLLMQGQGQDIRVLVEHRFGPVAVMDIPVKNGDAGRQPFGLCSPDRNANVGQEAKAIGPVRQAVMAGGT